MPEHLRRCGICGFAHIDHIRGTIPEGCCAQFVDVHSIDEMVDRAAKEMHAVSGHTFPSGKLTRWPDDLTDFQREQFRIQARRVLAVAFL